MSLPNELGVGRMNRVLQRLLQIKGGAPVPVLTPELVAVLVLESDRIEWKFLNGETLLAGRGSVGALAANFSASGIRNPSDSGALVVVEGQIIETAAAVSVRYSRTLAGAVASVAGVARDSRSGTVTMLQAGASRLVTLQTAAQQGSEVARFTAAAGKVMELGAVMAPGSEFLIASDAVNAPIDVSWLWRERAIEASETED